MSWSTISDFINIFLSCVLIISSSLGLGLIILKYFTDKNKVNWLDVLFYLTSLILAIVTI